MSTKPGVIGIDPGPKETAIALWDPNDQKVVALVEVPSEQVNATLVELINMSRDRIDPFVVVGIEQVRSYGMAVGAEVFDTVHWSGRFHQFLYDHFPELNEEQRVFLIPRGHVKMHLCNSMRAKDTNINQVIADRFGGKDKCKGTKKEPGPLFGIKGDMWAALGVALTLGDNLSDDKYVPKK